MFCDTFYSKGQKDILKGMKTALRPLLLKGKMQGLKEEPVRGE